MIMISLNQVTTEDVTREELSQNTLTRIAEGMIQSPWNIRMVDRDGFGVCTEALSLLRFKGY